MPINYLGSLKAVQKKLASLPRKRRTQSLARDTSLVQVRNLNYQRCGKDLCSITFAVANNGNYGIRSIKLFVVYRKVTNRRVGNRITKEDNVVSYTTTVVRKQILPKLAQQWSVSHRVQYCTRACTAEVRILDYEIDRRVQSPADLLFE